MCHSCVSSSPGLFPHRDKPREYGVLISVTVHGVKHWKSKAVVGAASEIGSILDPFSAFDTRKTLENRCLTP